jgi:hypothetical protein
MKWGIITLCKFFTEFTTYKAWLFCFSIYRIFPVSPKPLYFSSKDKSLSLSSIAKTDIIEHLLLYLLFLEIATEKEDSSSEKPVTPFGERFDLTIPF